MILLVKLLLGRGAAVPRQGAVHHDVCRLGEVIAVGHLRQLLRLATIDFPVAAVVALETPDWKYVTVDCAGGQEDTGYQSTSSCSR